MNAYMLACFDCPIQTCDRNSIAMFPRLLSQRTTQRRKEEIRSGEEGREYAATTVHGVVIPQKQAKKDRTEHKK
jgi:hypothetical protein